jgi:TrmH family RNA methyltransferase
VYQQAAGPLYNQFLLPESQRERIGVVLVSPRNPLNIGAVARAMANFGFSRLAVVAPYEPHWREAKSAVGAETLLQNAVRAEHLTEAVAECTLVVGTGTLAHRKPEQKVIALPALSPIVQQEIERGGRVALVFGSEKHGLTRDDLAHCHMFVEIPTDVRQPSMNLGQAVAVCLYELAAGPRSEPTIGETTIAPRDDAGRENAAGHLAGIDKELPASAGALELLAGLVEETMQAANYSPAAMRAANRRDLQLLLRKLTLTRRDARRIMGLFRRVLSRLQHSGDQTQK